MDNEKIIVCALKCVFDVLCIHGVKTFNFDQTENGNDEAPKKSKASDATSDSEEDSDVMLSPSTQNTIIELFLRLMNSEVMFDSISFELFFQF
jgi:hypothetical protein